MIQFTIDKLNCPSWNDMQTMHWSQRRKYMIMVKALTIAAIRKEVKGAKLRIAEQLPKPCPVSVIAYFKGSNRRDCDNLYVKPIMDGIVFAKLLKDDNCEIVRPLTIDAFTHQPEDKIVITLG